MRPTSRRYYDLLYYHPPTFSLRNFYGKTLRQNDVLTFFAEKTIREAEFPRSLVCISSTITQKQFFTTSGLRRLSTIVHKPTSAVEEVSHWRKQITDSIEKLGIGQGYCHEECQKSYKSHVAPSSSDTILLYPKCRPDVCHRVLWHHTIPRNINRGTEDTDSTCLDLAIAKPNMKIITI